MTLTTTPFVPEEYLGSPEAIEAYLQDAFDGGDPAEIADALGVVARARGMSKVAEEAGLARPALYRALSGEGNPEFATIMKVVKAMGMRLKPELA